VQRSRIRGLEAPSADAVSESSSCIEPCPLESPSEKRVALPTKSDMLFFQHHATTARSDAGFS
jgi:hypothetical protein